VLASDSRVLVITGAGVSVESGITTFRGTEGYWRKLDPAKLATPAAFVRDPELVWQWYRERRQTIRAAKPNAAHSAIVQLAESCPDFLLVTQNVDDLHARAEWRGAHLHRDKVVKIHGDIFMTRCSQCTFEFSEREEDSANIPSCPQCNARMRPGVVWFGESLDSSQIERVETFLQHGSCHVVLVVGTTAMFGYIVDWARRASGGIGKLIEINPEATSLSPFATTSIRQPAGVALPALVERMFVEA
jgi:NAD-dependent deacetylase